jgi:hypothetical protein
MRGQTTAGVRKGLAMTSVKTKEQLLLELLQHELKPSDEDEGRTPMACEERVKAGASRVLAALSSGKYVLRADSDGTKPRLCRTYDGACIDIPDDVMQRMIREGLIEFSPLAEH